METFRNSPRQTVQSSTPGPDATIIAIVIAFIAVYIISQSQNLRRTLYSFWFEVDSRDSTRNDKERACRRPEPYLTLSDLQTAMRTAGLEASHLIIGIDFTKSNTWSGMKSFEGFCLHDTSRKGMENPYQRVMRIISKSLSCYDEDQIIPAYGFGDIATQGKSCFPFYPDRDCYGLNEVLDRYTEIVKGIQLSGPTNFAPVIPQLHFNLKIILLPDDFIWLKIIQKATEIVKKTGQYHILLIIADGQVDKVQETIKAIVDASEVALSIVCVGVGDGPWDMMIKFDDKIPARRFDNFQFVELSALESTYASLGTERLESEFALAALMEIPNQYATIRRLGLM